MKSIKYLPLILLFWSVSCLVFPLYGQSAQLQKIISQLEKKETDQPLERVYVHHDKLIYALHETIWVKAYVTKGPYQLLSDHSKILYIDLVDPRDSVVDQLRLPIINGLAQGEFTLQETYGEGIYRMRSYTQWMRNFEDSGIFESQIEIGNAHPDNFHVLTSAKLEQGEALVEVQLAKVNLEPVINREVQFEVKFARRNIKGSFKTDFKGIAQIKFPWKDDHTDVPQLNLYILDEHQKGLHKEIPLHFETSGDPTIGFFAEGGRLLAGMEANLGFKALQSNGKSISAEGIILDQEGQKVAEFQTSFAGMGSVLFKPQAHLKYSAQVKFANGHTQSFPLPPVESSGYGIRVLSAVPSGMQLQAFVSEDLIQGQTLRVIIQQQGTVYYAGEFQAKQSLLSLIVPSQEFATGVCQITLLNEKMQPVSERMVFHYNPKDVLPIDLTTSKTVFAPTEKIEVSLSKNESNPDPHVTFLSAAVIDEEVLEVENLVEPSIFDRLWLKTEVKGYLEDGAYYFNPKNAHRFEHLDHLMLTQGWRKILWEKEFERELSYEVEKGIKISGKVLHDLNKKPIANNTVQLLPSGHINLNMVLDTLTDQEGSFRFEPLTFFGPVGFLLQSQMTGKSPFKIVLSPQPEIFRTVQPQFPNVTSNLTSKMHAFLLKEREYNMELESNGWKERSVLLEDVKISIPYKPKKVPYSDNMNGPGRADRIVLGEEMENYFSVSDVLVSNGMGVRNPSTGYLSDFILVDGMHVEGEYLDGYIKPMDVSSIEYLRSSTYTAPYMMRLGGDPPVTKVILITTRRGSRPGAAVHTPHIAWQEVKGYHLPRQFYSPDYSVPEEDRLPDLRGTTLHWEPQIFMEPDSTSRFVFYAGNKKGRFRILVEGIHADGRLVRAIHHIEIQ